MTKRQPRRLVILNQAANYLTVGFANAFNREFDSVTLVTGSVHLQGEELDDDIVVESINRWHERPTSRKALSYGIGLLRMWWLLMTRYRRQEVLFVSVPPMGYLLNLLLPHRFSMVIWDVYPDVLRIGGMRPSHPIYRLWSKLNRLSFRRAHRLFTISEPMAETLAEYVEPGRIVVRPIWAIEHGFERVPPDQNRFIQEHELAGKFIVQYSGNIGLTHNVEVLIDIAERLQHRPDILFQIIGRGPRKPYIERLVHERDLGNVQMLGFQSDEMFPHSLSAANLGVVILHESVSRGSVPSKTYNLMRFGIPALYVASENSELARYAGEYGHAKCFPADRAAAIVEFIEEVVDNAEKRKEMSRAARSAAAHFTRSNADLFVGSYFASGREMP